MNIQEIKLIREKGIKTIGIDQDWVLAKLNHKWINYYNTIFDDNLTVEEIKGWDIENYVKEEAKPYIFNILKLHKFYRNLEMVDDAQRVIKKLVEKGYEVYIISDPFTRMSYKSKYDWLREKLPFIPESHYVFTGDKSIIRTDVLIDDAVKNLENFNGIPLLYDAPHNRNNNSKRLYRAKNWQDIEHLFNNDLKPVYNFYIGNHEMTLKELKESIDRKNNVNNSTIDDDIPKFGTRDYLP